MIKFFYTFCTMISFSSLFAAEAASTNSADAHGTVKPYVIASVYAQMGNNMFQIATACALAWDNDAEAYFPDLLTNQLDKIPFNNQHMFFRCATKPPEQPLSASFSEPSFAYSKIAFYPNMHINGFFQSEKYFKHHQDKLLELFAPHPDYAAHIEKKYGEILKQPNTVGIQIRWYYEDPTGAIHIQYGRDYLDKAMHLFPEDSVFIVSSNNVALARQNIPNWAKNVVFLENEPHYIDFFVLSLCKHNIITNSTFGWWAAWLNKNPEKKIVAPRVYLNPNSAIPTQDMLPDSWVKLDAKWGGITDPNSYQ